MKPVGRKMTVDWYGDNETPEVGNVIRNCSADGTVKGYARVLSVRQAKVRVSRGENARYSLRLEPIDSIPPEGVTFTVTAHPPKPKIDRFSPLL